MLFLTSSYARSLLSPGATNEGAAEKRKGEADRSLWRQGFPHHACEDHDGGGCASVPDEPERTRNHLVSHLDFWFEIEPGYSFELELYVEHTHNQCCSGDNNECSTGHHQRRIERVPDLHGTVGQLLLRILVRKSDRGSEESHERRYLVVERRWEPSLSADRPGCDSNPRARSDAGSKRQYPKRLGHQLHERWVPVVST